MSCHSTSFPFGILKLGPTPKLMPEIFIPLQPKSWNTGIGCNIRVTTSSLHYNGNLPDVRPNRPINNLETAKSLSPVEALTSLIGWNCPTLAHAMHGNKLLPRKIDEVNSNKPMTTCQLLFAKSPWIKRPNRPRSLFGTEAKHGTSVLRKRNASAKFLNRINHRLRLMGTERVGEKKCTKWN